MRHARAGNAAHWARGRLLRAIAAALEDAPSHVTEATLLARRAARAERRHGDAQAADPDHGRTAPGRRAESPGRRRRARPTAEHDAGLPADDGSVGNASRPFKNMK
jgi:hypothetical protein